MGCGAVGQIIANPFDVIKVQMQNEGKRVILGLTPRAGVEAFTFR
jgi:hypothetical protein